MSRSDCATLLIDSLSPSPLCSELTSPLAVQDLIKMSRVLTAKAKAANAPTSLLEGAEQARAALEAQCAPTKGPPACCVSCTWMSMFGVPVSESLDDTIHHCR